MFGLCCFLAFRILYLHRVLSPLHIAVGKIQSERYYQRPLIEFFVDYLYRLFLLHPLCCIQTKWDLLDLFEISQILISIKIFITPWWKSNHQHKQFKKLEKILFNFTPFLFHISNCQGDCINFFSIFSTNLLLMHI